MFETGLSKHYNSHQIVLILADFAETGDNKLRCWSCCMIFRCASIYTSTRDTFVTKSNPKYCQSLLYTPDKAVWICRFLVLSIVLLHFIPIKILKCPLQISYHAIIYTKILQQTWSFFLEKIVFLFYWFLKSTKM